MVVRTFICMHCFSTVDINCSDELNSNKMLIDCPVCSEKIKAIPENADVSKVKYHFAELNKALNGAK